MIFSLSKILLGVLLKMSARGAVVFFKAKQAVPHCSNFKFYLSEVSEWYSRSPSYQRRKWCLLVITEVLLKPGSLFQWPSEVIKNLSIWFIEEKCRSKRTDFIAWTAALPLTCRRTSRPRSTETRSGRAGLWKTTPTLSLPPMSTSSMPERTLLQPTLTRWIW